MIPLVAGIALCLLILGNAIASSIPVTYVCTPKTDTLIVCEVKR